MYNLLVTPTVNISKRVSGMNIRFHSLNEAREYLGKINRASDGAIDYWKYCDSMERIRELTDSERYYWTAWREFAND